MEKNIIDKNLFFKFVNLLEAHNIFFWIDFGTLLGAYRDKGFIKWDIDVDLSLWAKDYWLIRKIIDLSDWKYKSIWRREITVYHESNPDFHIDLFFYDKGLDYCSAYVYLENKITKDINIESKMLVPTNLLKNFKTIKLYKHNFNIPELTNEYLSCHYGNWKDKDEKWYYSKRTNVDKNHSIIAIVIPTFLRDDKLQDCVNSILKTLNNANRFQAWFKIYIGEQGNISEEKQKFYNYLKELGHKIYKLPYNSGLAYSRNYLISQIKEPYVLIMDDDEIFTEKTNLDPLFNLLLMDESIGMVGGKLNDRETLPLRFYIDQNQKNSCLSYIVKPINYLSSFQTKTQKIYRYFKTEEISNFFLAKTEVFNDIKWDNELKLVEHSDFFLRLKTTKWKVLFTPDCEIEHHPENNSNIYNSFRDTKTGKNCATSLYKFKQKYNINSNNKKITPIIIENLYLPPSKIKIVQLAKIPCANSGLELNNLINNWSDKFQSRYILGIEYGGKNKNIPYRKFPMDLYWQTQKEECLKILKEADIVHVHHDIINDNELISILKTKKVIWTLYNLSQSLQYENNDFNNKYIIKCKNLSNIITVADQSLQRKMFSDITEIKVPLIKILFDYNTIKTNDKPLIVFAPTNRVSEGIATKKYYEVIQIIEELKNEGYSFLFDLIEGVPYKENLERKQKADILIDDVDPIYEKFHNSSLEAACFGAISLTNYSGEDYPFIKTNINNLKETLIKFITNRELLKKEQEKIIQWRKNNYTPERLLNIYENIYNDILKETHTSAKPIELINSSEQQFKIHSTSKEKKEMINTNQSYKIAICLTTFLRDNLLYKTLQTIVDNHTKDCIVLLADEGYANEEKDINIDFFKSQIPLEYYHLPFFSGISAARNFLVEKAKEKNIPYILLTADSIQFLENYNFDTAIDFLESDINNGIIGFNLLNYATWRGTINLIPKQHFYIDIPDKAPFQYKELSIVPVEMCSNFFLAKTNALIENKWDDELKLMEFEDFFWRLKTNTKYKVFFTSDIHGRYISNRTKEYEEYRGLANSQFNKMVCQKYGLIRWVKVSPVFYKHIKKEVK